MSYDDQGQPANNDPYSYQDPSQYDPSQGYTGYESGSYENQGYDNSGYAPTPPPQEQQPTRPQLQQLQRIPSGIPGFDQIVGGGLIRDRVYLLAGPAGAGKTIFSTQFLYNGISKYNENGIYVVLEETPQQLRENMYNSFGWNIQTYEDNGNIIVLDAISSRLGLSSETTLEQNVLQGNSLEEDSFSMKVRARKIEIPKMRGTSHSQYQHPFIINENGIEIKSEPEVTKRLRRAIFKAKQVD